MNLHDCKSGNRYTFICDNDEKFRATFVDILKNPHLETLRTKKNSHIKEGMLTCPANWIKYVEHLNTHLQSRDTHFTYEILEIIDQYI